MTGNRHPRLHPPPPPTSAAPRALTEPNRGKEAAALALPGSGCREGEPGGRTGRVLSALEAKSPSVSQMGSSSLPPPPPGLHPPSSTHLRPLKASLPPVPWSQPGPCQGSLGQWALTGSWVGLPSQPLRPQLRPRVPALSCQAGADLEQAPQDQLLLSSTGPTSPRLSTPYPMTATLGEMACRPSLAPWFLPPTRSLAHSFTQQTLPRVLRSPSLETCPPNFTGPTWAR